MRHKLLLAAIAVLAVFAGRSNSGFALKSADPVKYLARVHLDDFAGGMRSFRELDLEIAGVNLRNQTVDLLLADDELDWVNRRGMQLKKLEPAALQAPDSQYQTPEKIDQFVHSAAATYPGIARVASIGKSAEGRDIWALEITQGVGEPHPGRPAVLFNGMHHAREVMSTEVPLDLAQQLLSKYGQDAQVTRWVDNTDIWVVPMVNPDGNHKVWTSNNMWRKNTRQGYGTDINRNYPYAWKTCNGSSGMTASDTYRGPSAGSEPETQALMSLVTRIRPVFDISFHSYSELVLYPYGCPDQRTATHEVVETIGAEMAKLLPSDEGSDHYTAGTPWETLYAVDGDDIGWMYHEMQVIAYVIEVNSDSQGFQPSYSRWRDQTVTKLRSGWSLLLNRLDGAGIHGSVLDRDSHVVEGASVVVERKVGTGQPTFTQTYRMNPDGTYHLVLNPGLYTMTYQAPGHVLDKRDLQVGGERVSVDVKLDTVARK